MNERLPSTGASDTCLGRDPGVSLRAIGAAPLPLAPKCSTARVASCSSSREQLA